MNNVIKRIHIDLYSPTSYEVIKTQQGDKNSRIIKFILYDQGSPYELSDNVSLRFVGHRGDGSYFSKAEEECIARDGNHIDVTLPEDILCYAGTIEAKLVMYGLSDDGSEEKVLSTIPFKISCMKNPCDENNLSKGEHSIVTDLIFQVKGFSDRAKDIINEAMVNAGISSEKADEAQSYAEESRLKSEEAANRAKDAAEEAKNAEGYASVAKSHADNAERSADASSQKAADAANSETNAKESENAAKESETASKTSETNAKASEENAKASETNAESSKAAAADSAAAAETSAANAESSAITATGKADEAAASANNAEDSAETAGQKAEAAAASADNADAYAKQSESFARGGTGTREGEDTDNAEFYYLNSKSIYDDFISAGNVVGVKGNAESDYRNGYVNLTPSDIGALPISGGTMTGRVQIPTKALNYFEATDLSNAAIGILRPANSASAFFSIIAEKTLSDYVWCLGTIQDEVGFYGYKKDGVTPFWQFTINAANGESRLYADTYSDPWIAHKCVLKVSGDVGIAGAVNVLYPNPINVRHVDGASGGELYLNYTNPTKPIMLGNGGHSISSNGAQYSGNAATATAATKATQDGNGNNIVNTYAKKSIYGDTAVSMGRKAGTTVGENSFVVGYDTEASGIRSHAEGSETTASGINSHAEGYQTTANGYTSHAEGDDTTASGSYSHAEGNKTTASGYASHAEGNYTLASENYSHAEGHNTTASNYSSHSMGKYNADMTIGANIHSNTGTALAIGNGSDLAKSNAFSVMFSGVVKAKSTITASTTADYAEFFEWHDGNPDGEDRVGRLVTSVGDKITVANSDSDYILGVISGEPFVLGNGDCDTWNGMYLRDEFNRTIYEPAPKMELDEETGEEKPVLDSDGNSVYEGERPVLNPEYDSGQPYISRFDRKEWSPVGMLGVLSVIDDGTCEVGGYCKCADGGTATKADGREYIIKDGQIAKQYLVIERVSENVVRIVFR